MEAGRLIIRRPNPVRGGEHTREVVEINVKGDGHGGGGIRA